jgi:4-amino-4-deoxy-L-arabinose transferase-like glycosyltransferase
VRRLRHGLQRASPRGAPEFAPRPRCMTVAAADPRLLPLPAGAPAAARLAAWLARSHWRAVAVLVLLALACFLPGLAAIPPVDRDEARFAQSTRQMLETGNYVDIRFQEGTRYKKPIGIYWLQAALVKLTGGGPQSPIGRYRLASLLGALAAVLLTYWATLPLFGRTAGFVAAAAMAVSVVLVAEAHLAKTDAVLLATVLLAQGALARLYLADDAGPPALLPALCFWVGLALGILVKGPIVVMVAGLTILALVVADRRAGWLRRLRPLIGVPLAAAIVLPWFVAILSLAGTSFIGESVGHDLAGKLASSQEGHAAPPGTHFVLFWFIFWPAAALLLAALPWIWRERRQAPVRFALAWLVPSFLVFEAVATKLPHYPLPVYPAAAALIGGAVAAAGLARSWLLGRLPVIFAAAGGIAVAAALLVALDRFGDGITLAAAAPAAAAAGLAASALVPGWRGQPCRGVARLALAAVALHLLAFGLVAPALSGQWLTPRIAAALARDVPCPSPLLAAAGYEEASLIFTVGTAVKTGDGIAAADFLALPGCRAAIVDPSNEPAFLHRAAARGTPLDKRATIAGLNVGRAAMTSVSLYIAAGRAR